ncbi:MAG: type II toxin-antitoxin system PemK/MazF family toxin [Clostridiales bacterium]|nr:type II toxin-antitoxin system PemK/MazF family toxin [Clostridiales bacterium]
MAKAMTQTELKQHCTNALEALKTMMVRLTESNIEQFHKKAMLIAYWIKSYVRHISTEDEFNPQSTFRLKRGSIVLVDFGYRIGRELGGQHYAVVIDRKNHLYRNTVTVIPLSSLKEHSKQQPLTDGIYIPFRQKIDALIADAEKTIQEAESMAADINTAAIENKLTLRTIQRNKIDFGEKLIAQANAWSNEMAHLKKGSIALVDQIITISKMRIIAPLKKTHPLYGLRLSNRDLDQIDKQLIALYFPENKISPNH